MTATRKKTTKKKTPRKKAAPRNGQPARPLRLEWRKASELDDNPRNWRRHPEQQLDAIRGVIGEVGWAGVLLFNERTGRLVDGHARKAISGEEEVPVIVGDWTEDQERTILATLDPIAGMAQADAVSLDALLREVNSSSIAVQELLAELAESAGMYSVEESQLPKIGDSDHPEFLAMTFILHESQAELVKGAVGKAAAKCDMEETPNSNKNGNALAYIAKVYCGICQED